MTETELAFCEILNCDRASLYLNKDSLPGKDNSARLAAVLKRRASGEPLQYILGKAEFRGLEFKVTPDVLIPRPETELVVETALEAVVRISSFVSRINILEIGTGSGCIAVSLAKFLPEAKLTATDISQKALDIAKQNARSNKVNIDFIKADVFNEIRDTRYEIRDIEYDLIISNPPYIPAAEINNLQPELQYEPRVALDGGKDGLDFYRRIIKEGADYLIPAGFLIMEIGFGQKEAIKNIIVNSNKFKIMEIVRDYNNIERVVVAKRAL